MCKNFEKNQWVAESTM